MALLRGALGMMKLSHIDLLVVGLPVALFAVKKAALEKAMTGKHDVGDGKTVTVAKALAVAQPQGALVHYASVHQKMAEIGKEQSLIIDPGSRTFDWLVAQGMRLVQKQSHSINRGMSDVLRLIAHAITKDIGTPYRDFDAIDLALRTGKPPVIFQKPYDMKHLMPLAESVADQAVSSMKEWLEAPHSLQNIILVGGGAFLFRKAVKAAFPRHRIHEVKEPMFANVRGFQLAGQNYARSVMAVERDHTACRPEVPMSSARCSRRPRRFGWCSSSSERNIRACTMSWSGFGRAPSASTGCGCWPTTGCSRSKDCWCQTAALV